jgi:hypothetical protein
MVSFMNCSDSGATPANVEGRGTVSTSVHGPCVHRGLLATRVIEASLYVLYALGVMLMLGCYFLNPPADRRGFYYRSAVAWRTFAASVFQAARHELARAPLASPPRKLAIPAGQAVIGCLDQVQGEPVISVVDGSEVLVSGWAGCSNGSPLPKVEILVDNQVRAIATMSFPRPDVAAAFGRSDLDHSGWRASFSGQGLRAGTHSVAARVTCATGRIDNLPPFKLIVTGK